MEGGVTMLSLKASMELEYVLLARVPVQRIIWSVHAVCSFGGYYVAGQRHNSTTADRGGDDEDATMRRRCVG